MNDAAGKEGAKDGEAADGGANEALGGSAYDGAYVVLGNGAIVAESM